MKIRTLDFLAAALLLIIAAALTQIRADKPYLFLLPSPGAVNQVEIMPGQQYQYDFQIHQPTSLARFGLYFSPAGSLPALPITITISQAGKVKGEADLAGAFIDSEGPSFWQFNPPLKLEAGMPVTATLNVPAEFANKIKLDVRQPDESFRAEETTFKISGSPQLAPLAYEVYSSYTPPLAPQLAMIAVLIAAYLIIKPRQPLWQEIGTIVAAGAAVAVYLVPTNYAPSVPWFLLITQSGAALAVFWYLRGRGLHQVPAATAAVIVSCSSWLPLHYSAGRFLYGLLIPIALLFTIINRSQPTIRRRLAALLALVITIFVFTLPIIGAAYTYNLNGYSNIRDIFLDPYQVPHAEKAVSFGETPVPWHNFGAYIGIPAMLASLIGMGSGWRKHRLLLGITLALAVIISIHVPPPVSMVVAHSSIFLVCAFAYFAAIGLENIRRFLGYEDKIVQVLVTLVGLFITLDIWHTVSDVLSHLS